MSTPESVPTRGRPRGRWHDRQSTVVHALVALGLLSVVALLGVMVAAMPQRAHSGDQPSGPTFQQPLPVALPSSEAVPVPVTSSAAPSATPGRSGTPTHRSTVATERRVVTTTPAAAATTGVPASPAPISPAPKTHQPPTHNPPHDHHHR